MSLSVNTARMSEWHMSGTADHQRPEFESPSVLKPSLSENIIRAFKGKTGQQTTDWRGISCPKSTRSQPGWYRLCHQHQHRPGPEVIRFTVGQPDFGTPQPVVDEAKAALDRGRDSLPPPAGNGRFVPRLFNNI